MTIWGSKDRPPVDPSHAFNQHGLNATGADEWLTHREDGASWSNGYFLDPGHPDAAQYTTNVPSTWSASTTSTASTSTTSAIPSAPPTASPGATTTPASPASTPSTAAPAARRQRSPMEPVAPRSGYRPRSEHLSGRPRHQARRQDQRRRHPLGRRSAHRRRLAAHVRLQQRLPGLALLARRRHPRSSDAHELLPRVVPQPEHLARSLGRLRSAITRTAARSSLPSPST